MRIELTRDEFLLGAEAGARRHARALALGRVPRYGPPVPLRWAYNVTGAVGELAFAKGANLFWLPDDELDKDRGDVGGYQVRATDMDHGSLVLQERDADEEVFVLMVGQGCHWRIAGWLTGREGKQKRFWREPPEVPYAAWFVPQSELHAWPPDNVATSSQNGQQELDLT